MRKAPATIFTPRTFARVAVSPLSTCWSKRSATPLPRRSIKACRARALLAALFNAATRTGTLDAFPIRPSALIDAARIVAFSSPTHGCNSSVTPSASPRAASAPMSVALTSGPRAASCRVKAAVAAWPGTSMTAASAARFIHGSFEASVRTIIGTACSFCANTIPRKAPARTGGG